MKFKKFADGVWKSREGWSLVQHSERSGRWNDISYWWLVIDPAQNVVGKFGLLSSARQAAKDLANA